MLISIGSILFLCCKRVTAQLIFEPSFAVGMGFRGVTIPLEDKPVTGTPFEYFNYRFGDRVRCVIVDVKQKVLKDKYILQLSNYFSYNELRQVRIAPGSNIYKSDKRFKRDYFLDFLKPIKLKKKWPKLIVGAGYGLLNCGTRFDNYFTTGSVDPAGNLIYNKESGSFRFWAPRVTVGLQESRINALVICTLTPDREFDKNPSLWLEFKTTYTFNTFQKKK